MQGSTTLTNQFRAKWGKEPGYDRIDGYTVSRYLTLDERFAETFRYVEPSPANRLTFSYEFSSILRDSGSVFDSAMRELLDLTGAMPRSGSDYDFLDHRKFLKENVDRQGFPTAGFAVETIVLQMRTPWGNRTLTPFAGITDDNRALEWWRAYNDVKHSDLEKLAQGNLVNCVNMLGALAIIATLVGGFGVSSRTFYFMGFIEPMDQVNDSLF
jgi:hypothetical protein